MSSWIHPEDSEDSDEVAKLCTCRAAMIPALGCTAGSPPDDFAEASGTDKGDVSYANCVSSGFRIGRRCPVHRTLAGEPVVEEAHARRPGGQRERDSRGGIGCSCSRSNQKVDFPSSGTAPAMARSSFCVRKELHPDDEGKA